MHIFEDDDVHHEIIRYSLPCNLSINASIKTTMGKFIFEVYTMSTSYWEQFHQAVFFSSFHAVYFNIRGVFYNVTSALSPASNMLIIFSTTLEHNGLVINFLDWFWHFVPGGCVCVYCEREGDDGVWVCRFVVIRSLIFPWQPRYWGWWLVNAPTHISPAAPEQRARAAQGPCLLINIHMAQFKYQITHHTLAQNGNGNQLIGHTL